MLLELHPAEAVSLSKPLWYNGSTQPSLEILLIQVWVNLRRWIKDFKENWISAVLLPLLLFLPAIITPVSSPAPFGLSLPPSHLLLWLTSAQSMERKNIQEPLVGCLLLAMATLLLWTLSCILCQLYRILCHENASHRGIRSMYDWAAQEINGGRLWVFKLQMI